MGTFNRLRAHRDDILRLAAEFRARNVRVFGSAARGDDTGTSDIDLLVDWSDDASLTDWVGFQQEVARVLGREVDVVSEASLHWYIRDEILAEAPAAMKGAKLNRLHIIECIEKIELYTADGRTSIENGTLVLDAVLRNLQTLSEATQRLPDDLKARHPDGPWHRIAGFRNILVHHYFGGIDAGIVWSVVEAELPAFRRSAGTL